jgi:hypothetical protein
MFTVPASKVFVPTKVVSLIEVRTPDNVLEPAVTPE